MWVGARMLMLFSTLAAIALTMNDNACVDGSACGTNVAMSPDVHSLDETSLLQTVGRISSRTKIQDDQLQHDTKEESRHDALTNVRGKRGLLSKRSKIDIGNTNLIVVRMPKTASTTCCGIARRIAAHHNLSGAFVERGWPGDLGEPGVWAAHGALSPDDFGQNDVVEPVFANRDLLPNWDAVQALKLPVFMWTVLREPAKRALSQLYFISENPYNPIKAVDLALVAPEDVPTSVKIEYLSKFENNQYRYIRPSASYTVEDVVNTYDSIALTERLDESLVVLAAMLKVPLSDVLYMGHSKGGSSGYMDGSTGFHHNHPSLDEEPEEVRQLLAGQFREENDLDYQLYQLANKTLDAKIAEMNLEPAVKAFKKFLEDVQDDCFVADQDKAPVETLTKCMVDDVGCNYECLDKYDQIGRDMCEWCD